MDFLSLIPGFVQGTVRVLISYPFDYIRTNLQTQQYISIRDFYKRNDMTISKLYRGLYIPLLTVPIDRAIQFYIFEWCNKNKYTTIQSSLMATSISSIYSIPVNYLQTIVMAKNTKISFKSISYKGLYSDISRSFLSSFFYLSIYGKLRELVPKEKHNYFLFGIAASTGMWSLVYPIDTIRVLKQTSNLSYLDIIKNNNNIVKLYRGYPLVLLRSLPSSGFGMMSYEYSKTLITKYKDELQ
jgi:hypothetical protein